MDNSSEKDGVRPTRRYRRIQSGDEAVVNESYIKLSKKYKTAKYIATAALVLYIVAAAIIFRGELTPSNLRYMLRQLDADATVYSYDADYRTLTYNDDSKAVFAMFRDGFVRADSSNVTIIGSGGSLMLDADIAYSRPVLCPTAKNMLAYDLGGKAYSLISPFTVVRRSETEYPIYGGAVNENGMFAVISKTYEYRGAVYVYDPDGNEIAVVYKDRMIMGAALSPSGERLVILSALNSDSKMAGEVSVCDPTDPASMKNITLDGELPLMAEYDVGGSFTVTTDKSLRFFDKNGTQTAEYDFKGVIPTAVDISNGRTAVAFASNVLGSESRIAFFGSTGRPEGEITVDTGITGLQCGEDCIYILGDDTVIRYDIATGSSSRYDTGGGIIDFGITDDEMRLSGAASTVFVPLSEAFGAEGSK